MDLIKHSEGTWMVTEKQEAKAESQRNVNTGSEETICV